VLHAPSTDHLSTSVWSQILRRPPNILLFKATSLLSPVLRRRSFWRLHTFPSSWCESHHIVTFHSFVTRTLRNIGKSNYANHTMARLGDFSFPDFNFDSTHPTPLTHTNVLPTPIQTQPHYYPGTSTGASPSALEPPTPTTATNTAQKRKASSPLNTDSLEEDSRAVAEEDKRRRNTAASARFRVKKKQREQALEKSAKEMSDKVAALEGRINQLETENKWLKNLVTEKTETKEDIATLWKKYSAEKESSPEERTKGVGTA